MSTGTDFHCDDDITADWAVAESEAVAFGQALYRRLYLASLFYDDDYGLGIDGYLLDTVTKARMTSDIQTELLKDERVRDVSVQWLNDAATILATDHKGVTHTLTIPIGEAAAALNLPEAE